MLKGAAHSKESFVSLGGRSFSAMPCCGDGMMYSSVIVRGRAKNTLERSVGVAQSGNSIWSAVKLDGKFMALVGTSAPILQV